jgi:hypothetical protein
MSKEMRNHIDKFKNFLLREQDENSNLNISDVSESYSDEKVKQIGIEYENFRRYIKNLDYDDLMEYAELSQQSNISNVLNYLKKKSKFL